MLIDYLITYICAYPKLFYDYEIRIKNCAYIKNNNILLGLCKYFDDTGETNSMLVKIELSKLSSTTEMQTIFEIESQNCIIDSVTDFESTLTQIEEECKIIQLKQIAKKANEMFNQDLGSDAIVECIKDDFAKIGTKEVEILRFDEGLDKAINELQNKRDVVSFKKFQSFNYATDGGFSDGEYIINIGYAKSGKTTVTYNQAIDLAEQNIPVCYNQTELTEKLSYANAISILHGIPYKQMRSGQFDRKQIIKKRLPLYLVDIRKLDEMLAIFKTLSRNEGVRTFFVDQLSHLEPSINFRSDLTKQYTYVSKKIEGFVKQENIKLILNVQDGRGGKGHVDSSSINWSDAMIKDGDFVFKINVWDNLTPEIKKTMGNFIPQFPEYTSIIAMTESRHTAVRGIISAVQTFANKSMREIWSANPEFNTKYQMQKQTI